MYAFCATKISKVAEKGKSPGRPLQQDRIEPGDLHEKNKDITAKETEDFSLSHACFHCQECYTKSPYKKRIFNEETLFFGVWAWRKVRAVEKP
jgi:hypothetical protein